MRAKLAELQDLVESNLVESAGSQKATYDKHSASRSFTVGDPVWLSVPTAGKLDPRWEGEWTIKSVLSPITMEITDGKRSKVVHVNRLQSRVQPTRSELRDSSESPLQWEPPQIEHLMDDSDMSPVIPSVFAGHLIAT